MMFTKVPMIPAWPGPARLLLQLNLQQLLNQQRNRNLHPRQNQLKSRHLKLRLQPLLQHLQLPIAQPGRTEQYVTRVAQEAVQPGVQYVVQWLVRLWVIAVVRQSVVHCSVVRPARSNRAVHAMMSTSVSMTTAWQETSNQSQHTLYLFNSPRDSS
jgi:hypothetical protein